MDQTSIVEKTTKVSHKTNAFKHLMSIHWLMAAAYPIIFVVGMAMSRMPNEFPFRSGFYGFHKGLGVITMAILMWRIVVLLRVWWRKYVKHLPKFTPVWFRKVALHTILYLFMWAVPFTGVVLSNSYRSNNVQVLWITLPDLFPKNPQVKEIANDLHFWLAYAFLAFVVLHAIDQQKVVRANWRRLTNWLGTARAS